MPIRVGDLAPDSTLFTTARPRLPQMRDQWTVLYFYPLGNNPHCVMQSRRFQTLLPQFEAFEVRLIGVSVDSEEEQRSFRSLCEVSFTLVSDEKHEISRAYGVLDSVTDKGKVITFARRESFLINPQGRVVHHWQNVDASSHAAEVLRYIQDELGIGALA